MSTLLLLLQLTLSNPQVEPGPLPLECFEDGSCRPERLTDSEVGCIYDCLTPVGEQLD